MELSRPSEEVRPLDRAPGVRLHGGTAMLAASVVLALVFVAANLPGPLYVLYAERFGFSELVLTVVYAVYVIGSILAVTIFGRIADQIGRRPVLLLSIVLCAASAVVFFLTFNTATLLTARVVSGLALGLTATACTAWIAELQPDGDRRIATLFATGANLTGLALGPLIAGLLAQFAPAPLRLPYIVYFVGLVVPALVVWTVHETVKSKRPWSELSFRPRLGVPEEIAGRFIAPAVAAFVAFAVMGFYSALIPTLLEKGLKIASPAAGGGVTCFFFACGVAAIALSARLPSRATMLWGLGLLVPGVVLLVLAQPLGSLAALLVSSAIGGPASALGYRGSLQVINEIAPADRRAETISTYLLVCYCGVSLPVIGIGLLSRPAGEQLADIGFAALLCIFAFAAFLTDRHYGGEAR